MRTATIALVLAGCVVLAAGPGAVAETVVTDVQVRELAGGERYVLQIRSSGPQAFDVLPGPRGTVRVRLHGARLGDLDGLGLVAFGAITVTEEAGGHVLLRIELADPATRVRVTQGGNANVVEVSLSRLP